MTYFSSGVWAGFRRIASRSILVALSLVDRIGCGGGDKLRVDCCVLFGIFIDIPTLPPDGTGRDSLSIQLK